MDERLDLSLLEAKLPNLGLLSIPADPALCEDDYESDYSNPPLLVTSSQCCSPTLSPYTFDNDELGSIITDPLPPQTELPIMSAIRHIDSFINLTDTKKISQTATQSSSPKRRTRPSSTRTKTVSTTRTETNHHSGCGLCLQSSSLSIVLTYHLASSQYPLFTFETRFLAAVTFHVRLFVGIH